MSQTQPGIGAIVGRLTAELKRDKKRAGILGALLVMLVVLGGRMLLQKAGPTVAAAAPVRALASAEGRPGDVAPQAPLARHAPVRNGHIALTRDLFAPNRELFPPVKPAPLVQAPPPTQPATDEEAQREAHRKVIEAQAQALSIEGTILSDMPVVMINGKTLKLNQTILDFKVVQINPNGCVLEKEGQRVTLSKKPD